MCIDARDLDDFEGFEIRIKALEEDTPIDWDNTPEELEELHAKINDGELIYFCAKVTASLKGIELGSSYLGGCCYVSLEDFIGDDKEPGYFQDMRAEAVEEAKTRLIDFSPVIAGIKASSGDLLS